MPKNHHPEYFVCSLLFVHIFKYRTKLAIYMKIIMLTDMLYGMVARPPHNNERQRLKHILPSCRHVPCPECR